MGSEMCIRDRHLGLHLHFDESGRPLRYRSLQVGVLPVCLIVIGGGTGPGCLPPGPVMSPDVTFTEQTLPTCPRRRRLGRYSLMSLDDPDGTDHCRWAFFPLGWSCETVEPARDACLWPGMSPEVTAAAPSSWLRRSASRTLHFEQSARARRYIRLLLSIGEAENII